MYGSSSSERAHLRKEIVVHVDGDVCGLQRRSLQRLHLGLGAVPRVLLTVRITDHPVFSDDDLREFPARTATKHTSRQTFPFAA